MMTECKPTREQDFITIEKAVSIIQAGHGFIDGFPVHDGKTVFIELLDESEIPSFAPPCMDTSIINCRYCDFVETCRAASKVVW